MTVVVQRILGVLRTLDARDGAQIRVNGQEVVVRHALKIGPRHDLEKIAVERRDWWKAVCRYFIRTVWMKMVKILPLPEDFAELFKRVIPFRQSSFGRRRQVA